MAESVKLDRICRSRRLIVTLGPGGVGKTTLAAVIGLHAAQVGRRALVMTVDPALRLADALGMPRLQPGKRGLVSRRQMERAGFSAGQRLQVCQMDTGSALASAIERKLPPGERREKILSHPFFLRLRSDLAGAREYAACEEVVHLLTQPDLDVLVLDTPPSNHALDFLQAPDRLLEVIDQQAWRWLMRPALLAGRVGLMALDFAGGYMVRTISRFTGLEFLRELAGFLDLLSGLVEAFRRRAAEFRQLVHSEQCALLLVTSAEERPIQEALRLRRALSLRGLEPQLLLANQIVPEPSQAPAGQWRDALARALRRVSAAEEQAVRAALERLEGMRRLQQELACRQRERLNRLRQVLGQACPLVEIPLLEQDIHDLESLVKLHRKVFSGDEAKEAR